MSSEDEDFDYADESETEESEVGESESAEDLDDEAEYPEERQVDYIDPLHCRNYIIPPDERRTSSILTKEEVSKLLSMRIAQIEHNSPILTDVTGLTSPIAMAKKELIDRKCPILVHREDTSKRTLTSKYFEVWDPNEMGLPDKDSWSHY